MSSGRLQRTLLQTATYALGIGASKGVALLLVPFYTRQMPPTDIALWDLCTTTVLFVVAIAEVGMAAATARFYIQADDEAERAAVCGTANTIVWTMALVTIGCAWYLRATGARVILGDPNQATLLVLVGAVAAATVIANQPLAQLRAQERSIAFSLLNLVRAVVGPGVIIYLVFGRGLGVSGILYGELAGLAVMGLAGLGMTGRYAIPSMNAAALRKLLSFGVPIVPIGLSTAIVLVSDRYFLRANVGLDQLAIYAVGFKIATVMALATQALQTAWAPSAFRIAKQPDAPDALARSFRILVFGVCSLALGLSAFAPELKAVVAPAPAYDGADRIVPLIAFSYALQAALLIMTANLVISNRTILATIQFCAGAVVKLALNAWLIPLWGIDGAAVATLAAFMFQIIVCYWFTRLIYPVPYELTRLAILATTLATIVALTIATYAIPWYFGIAIRMLLLVLFLVIVFRAGVIPRAERVAGSRYMKQLLRLSGTSNERENSPQ